MILATRLPKLEKYLVNNNINVVLSFILGISPINSLSYKLNKKNRIYRSFKPYNREKKYDVYINYIKNISDMVKKGKYRLFSYVIENHLIYYKSLKKKNKIIAFTILECLDFKSLEPILNDFLKKRVLHYFSLQISTNKEIKNIILLNFEDNKKESIIKSFSIVKQIFTEFKDSIEFLKDTDLEQQFLAIFFQNINSSTSISKISEAISISTENKLRIFNFYNIHLDVIEERNSFLINFINLINNLGRIGILIFNFQVDYNEHIKLFAYFVEVSENVENHSNLEKDINSFFNTDLIDRQNIKIQEIFNYFWRLGVVDTYYFLNDFHDLFCHEENLHSLDLLEINKQIEKNLAEYQIEYVRLNTNLLFIEYNYLFVILENINSEYIHRILNNRYPKYFIYILILNHLVYEKLLEMDLFEQLDNIKIIHPEKFQNFNYKEFQKR